MKRLQPAEKEATRYLKFKVHSEGDVEVGELVDSFWSTAIHFLGTSTLSSASPWIIANKYDEEKQEGVLRVNRDYEDDLRAVLTLLEDFGGMDGFIEVKMVSGSLSGVDT